MKFDVSVLRRNLLFSSKNEDELKRLLGSIQTHLRACAKHEQIAAEGEAASVMGIILSGAVEVQKIYPTGKNMIVAHLPVGSTFGEAVLFSKTNRYPATVVAAERTELLLFTKQELLKLFALDMEIMSAFMMNMSERLVLLNQKIEILSLGTLRQRIAYFLLKEHKLQQTERIALPFTKRVWAEHLNSARPSLSRELIYLREQGWIRFDDKTVTLLNLAALEGLLE